MKRTNNRYLGNRISKRILTAVISVLLLAAMVLPASADGGNWNKSLYRFNDFAETVGRSKFDAIEDMAYDNVEIYRFDFPICTLNAEDLKGNTLVEYADHYYANNDYGYGVDRDGVMLLVIPQKDEFLIKGYGRGEQIFTEDVLKDLKELYYTTTKDNGYAEGFLTYLDTVQQLTAASYAEGTAGSAGAGEGQSTGGEAEGYILHTDKLPEVYDAADMFTNEEEEWIAQQVRELKESSGMDFVVYTDMTTYGKSRGLQAADFYWDNGYGAGEDRSGGVLFICMEPGNRGWWTAGTGAAEEYYTERNINDLDDRLEPYMVDGNYSQGVIHYLQDTDVLFHTYEVPHEKNYVMAMIIALVIGAITGGVNVTVKTLKMNSIQKARAAADYVVPGSMTLSKKQDVYMRKYVTRTRKPPKSSSGSSHSSGGSSYSGGYHSSGGGHFSGGGRSF